MEEPRRSAGTRGRVRALDERHERTVGVGRAQLHDPSRAAELAQPDRIAVEAGLRVEVADDQLDVGERGGGIDRHSASTASPTRTVPGTSTPPQTPNGSGSSVSISERYFLITRNVLEIRHAGLGILRCHGATADEPVDPHDRVADRDATSRPGVLSVRRDTVDLEQHPEAAAVDAVLARLVRDRSERAARHAEMLPSTPRSDPAPGSSTRTSRSGRPASCDSASAKAPLTSRPATGRP